MNRSVVVFVLVTLFTIGVFAVAAASLDSATIENGFGIEGDATSSDPGSGLEFNGSQTGGSGGTGGGGFFDTTSTTDSTTDGDSSSLSPLLIVGTMIGIAGGGIALVFWATGNTLPTRAGTESILASSDETETPSESPDPSNEVYRAWWEMVRQLDVTQYQSRSPAELASMAVQAENDPETVAELTALFRSVRYGGVSVTDDVEQRAAAARDRLTEEDVAS